MSSRTLEERIEGLSYNANLDEQYRRAALESVATAPVRVDADCLEEPLRGAADPLLASVDD
ncbi:hypothetical protein [Natrinema salsiterrestre]|uniref:Uncharacterized protein n=1 Tax=Natrinema salsiterrestre TaxID=2950540 RepID=A0A9Q4L406_9EURY|nr:hypothetical protein [Natrinema salsiterrestre]MDF9745505.1 hypothetical protein [Natrinema salsiterrestre]